MYGPHGLVAIPLNNWHSVYTFVSEFELKIVHQQCTYRTSYKNSSPCYGEVIMVRDHGVSTWYPVGVLFIF